MDSNIKGMIDVGAKKETERIAIAHSYIKLPDDVKEKIKNNEMPKGNVLEFARAAGIMAGKKTVDIIPLCHNILIDCIHIDFEFKKQGILVKSFAKAYAKTGVEMEAMTAVMIAALTIYDMSKMFSKSIEIADCYLVEKRGGRSGVYKKEQ